MKRNILIFGLIIFSSFLATFLFSGFPFSLPASKPETSVIEGKYYRTETCYIEMYSGSCATMRRNITDYMHSGEFEFDENTKIVDISIDDDVYEYQIINDKILLNYNSKYNGIIPFDTTFDAEIIGDYVSYKFNSDGTYARTVDSDGHYVYTGYYIRYENGLIKTTYNNGENFAYLFVKSGELYDEVYLLVDKY